MPLPAATGQSPFPVLGIATGSKLIELSGRGRAIGRTDLVIRRRRLTSIEAARWRQLRCSSSHEVEHLTPLISKHDTITTTDQSQHRWHGTLCSPPPPSVVERQADALTEEQLHASLTASPPSILFLRAARRCPASPHPPRLLLLHPLVLLLLLLRLPPSLPSMWRRWWMWMPLPLLPTTTSTPLSCSLRPHSATSSGSKRRRIHSSPSVSGAPLPHSRVLRGSRAVLTPSFVCALLCSV